MQTLTMQVTIGAPIERVWAALTNHPDMARWPGIRRVRMRQAGSPDPNGLGAIREVWALGMWFAEEIVAFEPPRLMRYQIIEAKPGLEHEGGHIALTARGGSTDVEWTTRYRMRLPVLGGPLTWLLKPLTRNAFSRCLQFVKRELEAEATAPVDRRAPAQRSVG